MRGMDRRTYLERKFGGPAGADRVYGAIEGAAQQAGLAVNFHLLPARPPRARPIKPYDKPKKHPLLPQINLSAASSPPILNRARI